MIKNAEAAERTSVDKPRWAAKLVALKADREANKSQLRSLQKPDFRNQNLSAQIKRHTAEIAKQRSQHNEKWIAVDECKDQILEYEDEAVVLRGKIEKGEARLAQCYSEQKLALAAIDGARKELALPGPTDLANGIASMRQALH